MPTQNKKAKRHTYLFVVGGVISGVGKGVATSSIAKILQARGLSVAAIKIDQYFNLDAGTMNPTEHGEVFVLDNGLETDQDMGNYERFLGRTISPLNYMTSGMVYAEVLRRERNLEYGGRNVEAVPDIPNEIIRRIKLAAETENADVTLVEIGGTVGEYQNVLYLEAIRMMKADTPADVGVILVSYLPVPSTIGEMKTKPTQYAAQALNSAGLSADFILARAPVAVDDKRKEKIGRACNVDPHHVISAPDVESIYDIPVNFDKEGMADEICDLLNLKCRNTKELDEWKKFVRKSKTVKNEVNIAVIGKYFSTGDFVLSDVYISVLEAIKYSAYHLGKKPVIHYLSSSDFSDAKSLKELKKYDGVLIPGGFGTRGIAGKLKVIEYVRKNNIPYFGICYGMQLAVLEYAQNVLKLKNASTEEINKKAQHLVIGVMEDQKDKIKQKDMGGTMRLGAWPAKLKEGTHAAAAYGAKKIFERHRHRYEVNNEYVPQLEEAGVVFSGTSPDGTLMEIMELPKKTHPFFVGVQFHPEFLARPLDPHPLFTAFVKASATKRK